MTVAHKGSISMGMVLIPIGLYKDVGVKSTFAVAPLPLEP